MVTFEIKLCIFEGSKHFLRFGQTFLLMIGVLFDNRWTFTPRTFSISSDSLNFSSELFDDQDRRTFKKVDTGHAQDQVTLSTIKIKIFYFSPSPFLISVGTFRVQNPNLTFSSVGFLNTFLRSPTHFPIFASFFLFGAL